MKRSHACVKCSGTSIVHLAHVLDAGDWRGHGGSDKPERRDMGEPVRRQLAAVVRAKRFVGYVAQTEAYVCAACGYFEEYVTSPADTPWDDIEGATRLGESR